MRSRLFAFRRPPWFRTLPRFRNPNSARAEQGAARELTRRRTGETIKAIRSGGFRCARRTSCRRAARMSGPLVWPAPCGRNVSAPSRYERIDDCRSGRARDGNPAARPAYMPRSEGCDIGPLTTGACWGAASGAGIRFSKAGICGAGLPKSIAGGRPMPAPECAKPWAPPKPAPRAKPSVDPTTQASANTAAKSGFMIISSCCSSSPGARDNHPTESGFIGLASIGPLLSPSFRRAGRRDTGRKAPLAPATG